MLRKKVEIDGREVEFKASAAVPRIYRMKFRRDLFLDLQKIAKSVKKKGKKEDKESSEIPIEDLEMFENIAYIDYASKAICEVVQPINREKGTLYPIQEIELKAQYKRY